MRKLVHGSKALLFRCLHFPNWCTGLRLIFIKIPAEFLSNTVESDPKVHM